MKFIVRSLKFGVRSFLVFILLFTVHLSLSTASEKWPGVDKSVIEKVAKGHDREAREPFINTDQGDLLLFVFLLAGAAGGFIAGYYWRALAGKKVEQTETQKKRA